MTQLIAVASGKGGVGKTTVVANLGVALARLGKDVIILDGNLSTPNLGMHLGMTLLPLTLHDVLKGRADVMDVIYKHRSGLKVIPAGISMDDLRGIDARDLPNALLDLLGSADTVLIDASAGLGREAMAAIESSDEMIVVTNPDMPSVTDALKAVKLAEKLGTKIKGVVINRVAGHEHELTRRDVVDMLDVPVLGEIPEDEAVHDAIASRVPVVYHNPKSKAAFAFRQLAANITGEEFIVEKAWYQRLFGFLSR